MTTPADPADPADTAALLALSREQYVRLTTFRRSGAPVPTPVWLVADRSALGGRDGELLVITGAETGKVKRVRNGGRVLLVPSDSRGRVRPGAVELEAHAEVDLDPGVVRRTLQLVRWKHRLMGPLLLGAQAASRALAQRRGKQPQERAVLRIGPARVR